MARIALATFDTRLQSDALLLSYTIIFKKERLHTIASQTWHVFFCEYDFFSWPHSFKYNYRQLWLDGVPLTTLENN